MSLAASGIAQPIHTVFDRSTWHEAAPAPISMIQRNVRFRYRMFDRQGMSSAHTPSFHRDRHSFVSNPDPINTTKDTGGCA